MMDRLDAAITEARKYLEVVINNIAEERADCVYHGSEGVGPYESEFTDEQLNDRAALDRYAALVALRARYEERALDLACDEPQPSPACCSAHERMAELNAAAETLLKEDA